ALLWRRTRELAELRAEVSGVVLAALLQAQVEAAGGQQQAAGTGQQRQQRPFLSQAEVAVAAAAAAAGDRVSAIERGVGSGGKAAPGGLPPQLPQQLAPALLPLLKPRLLLRTVCGSPAADSLVLARARMTSTAVEDLAAALRALCARAAAAAAAEDFGGGGPASTYSSELLLGPLLGAPGLQLPMQPASQPQLHQTPPLGGPDDAQQQQQQQTGPAHQATHPLLPGAMAGRRQHVRRSRWASGGGGNTAVVVMAAMRSGSGGPAVGPGVGRAPGELDEGASQGPSSSGSSGSSSSGGSAASPSRRGGSSGPLIFVGIFTSHNAHGQPAAERRYDYALRRAAIRRTWLGAHRRREAVWAAAGSGGTGVSGGGDNSSDGVMVRFVAGMASADPAAEASLSAEAAATGDFLRLLGMQECYHCLANKTRAFFSAALDMYPSLRWIVKADDDVYLVPQRLPAAAVQWERMGAGYVGCMKRGKVWTEAGARWYEPQHLLLGPTYFMHAYGSAYALSAPVVRRVIQRNYHHLRLLANEDTSVGAWMLAHQVAHFEDMRLCSPTCHPAALAVLRTECAGLCAPLEDLEALHRQEACASAAPHGGPLPYLPSYPEHTAFEAMWV
ncbi:putative beta-1,3-galactosyltransferase 14, partial [Tetrabaena socialis]